MKLYHCMNCSYFLSYNLINKPFLKHATTYKKSYKQFQILQKNEPKNLDVQTSKRQ